VLSIKQHIYKKTAKGRVALGIFCAAFFIFAPLSVAQAQNAEKVQDNETQTTEGLNLNLAGTVLNSSLNEGFNSANSLINLPANSIGSTLFKLDISDPSCLSGVGQCLRRDDEIKLGLQTQFTSVSDKGLDLALKPRASVRFDEDNNSSALVGAVFEIGKDLSETASYKNNTWYVFAGADAEALSYSPNSMDRLTQGQFYLQDNIFVGDAQAGVGYRIGDADVSLSYMRREATSDDFNYSEDAAALSFTWKR
jgi:hypothetical protein